MKKNGDTNETMGWEEWAGFWVGVKQTMVINDGAEDNDGIVNQAQGAARWWSTGKSNERNMKDCLALK